MDLFNKIFRSTLGIDGRDFRSSPDNNPLDNHQNSEVLPPEELFSHIDKMFANFDRMFPGFANMFPIMEPEADLNSQPRSLRDQMLKEPDSGKQMQKGQSSRPDDRITSPNFFNKFWDTKPFWNRAIPEKLDTDLDEIVKVDGLAAVLDRKEDIKPPSHNYSSCYSRVSVSTRRSADGKLEEQRTVVDGEGNETTTVTRSVDGKMFKQTTTKKRNGEVKVKEDWSNVSSENEADFKERWNVFKSPRLDAPPPSGLLKDDHDAKTRSIFAKLFGNARLN